MWAVPCALAAAVLFGAANVAQMRATRRVGGSSTFNGGLLLRLLHDRLWLAGFGASAVGWLLQAVALYLAPVVLVQPLIVAELLFALPLAALVAGARLGRREWTGALLVAGGLAAFVLIARPAGEATDIPPSRWLIITVSVAMTVAALVLAAQVSSNRPMLQGTALAAGASVCFGLMSVDTKVVGRQFAAGQLRALGHFQPWLLAVVALTGLALAQNAFRVAPLSVSLPMIDVGEPTVASVIAVTAFGEHVGSGVAILAGVTAALIAVAAGVAVLDTSPLVRAAQQRLRPRPTIAPPDAHEGTCV